MRRLCWLLVISGIVAGCGGRQTTEPSPAPTANTTSPPVTALEPEPAAEVAKKNVATGPYQMTIDAPASGCGGLFSQPLVLNGDLIGDAGKFTFGTKLGIPPHGFVESNRITLVLTLGGDRLTGTLEFIEVPVNSPAALKLDSRSSVRPKASGTPHADGTVTGLYTGTLRLHVQGTLLKDTGQYCESAFAWTLTPR